MNHVLHCGDGIAGMAAMPDRSVDHVITDPPYDEHTHGMQRRGATGRDRRYGLGHVSISVERHIGFGAISAEDMARAAAQFARVAKRWVLVFCALEQQADWSGALTANGLEHVRFGLWHKPGSTPQFSGDRPGTACEAIEITHRPGAKHWNGGGGFGMWTEPIVKVQGGERVHPTQKPLALMESLVSAFTDTGELILDPFAGSATTGAACKRLGRSFLGWEIDPGFYEVGRKRLDAASEQFQLPRMTRPKQLPLSGPDKETA